MVFDSKRLHGNVKWICKSVETPDFIVTLLEEFHDRMILQRIDASEEQKARAMFGG